MKKTLSAGIILLLTCCASMALTWDEALSLARQNNNSLISAQKQLESQEWTYRNAFTPLLPQLSASAGLSETGTPTRGAISKSYSYGLSVSQNIFSGFSDIYNLQSAYADLEYQKASLMSSRADIFYDLRSVFLDLLTGQEEIGLLEKVLNQRKANARLIRLRYESGKEDIGNLMATDADGSQALYDLSSAQRNLELARLKLSQMLDRPAEQVSEEAAFEQPAMADLEQLMLASPSYLMAKSRLEAAEIAQKATISGFLPSVSFSGRYSNSGSSWPPDSASTSWSLNVSYSLFPGGSNFVQRAIYGAKLDQARQDHDQAVKDLRYTIKKAYDDYIDSLQALVVADTSLSAAKERAKIAQAKYLNGLLGFDEWNRIENSYILAEKSLLSRKKLALLAQAKLYQSYGGYVK